MYRIAPSILSADFMNLGTQIKEIENAGISMLHVDVMDGHFVNNISLGEPVLRSIRAGTKLTLDVHLMIEEPAKYAERFLDAGADILNFHIEAVDKPMEIIELIHSKGKKAALTVKPATPVEAVYEYLPEIEMVLIMSVEPGFGGQKLIPDALDKAKKLRQYAAENNLRLDIEMDGGVTHDNAAAVAGSGVNILVAGSSVFSGGDITGAINRFRNELNERGVLA